MGGNKTLDKEYTFEEIETDFRKVMKSSHSRIILNSYVFLGSGQSTSKVVSIAEILKRRHKHIQERIELGERLVQEFWEPKDEDECLDTLVVTRRIPTIHVLLDVP